ncbi:hypothetical protein LMG28614_00137 [Paraburkholderia ultramafica]|uniref:Uncharacterized protein n=1 Tax=Paraburkholderia ultramafica TaxID=1544867 RepID=A0A6S7BXB5_9BURK|nr:hypothetical protein [Paraburkholderia ultramafica]CAB3776058.1 hypothetical protein LMG28614_00137 [Paraburkholderia ultramafica]
MSTYKEPPRVTAGLSHAQSPSLPLGLTLRRWSLRVQWTIVALSAIVAIAAACWYGSYGAALGLAQFLVIFGLFGTGLIQATSTLRAQLNALCDGESDAGPCRSAERRLALRAQLWLYGVLIASARGGYSLV